MDADLTYQWLGPGILILGGLTFLFIQHFDRKQDWAMWLGGAYLSAAVGFTQIMLVRGDLSLANPLTIQTSLFTCHTFLVGGICALYHRRFPVAVFVQATALAIAAVIYTLFDGSMFKTRVTVDFGYMAAVNLFCASVAWRARGHATDIVIASVMALQALVCAARIVQIYLPEAGPVTPQNFGAFYIAVAMQTANALYAIVLGIALFARYFVATLNKLNRLADTDPLTGLLNRRAFEQRAHELRVATAPAAAGLIICDIDHFKRINDGYGHEAGDQALVTFAVLLRETAGEGALCARLGGEEFCVLLPRANQEMTMLTASTLRSATEMLEIDTPAGTIRMTASFGYREVKPGENLQRAMAETDSGVYRAKTEGRNRIRVAGATAKPVTATLLDRQKATG